MFNILTTNQGIEIATIVIFLTLLIKKNYDVFLDKSAFKLISTLRKTMNENWIYISLNSLILNLTNFLHRYFILLLIDKTYAGVLFFCFSMGSFPANLFNFVFSSTIIRNKINFKSRNIFNNNLFKHNNIYYDT